MTTVTIRIASPRALEVAQAQIAQEIMERLRKGGAFVMKVESENKWLRGQHRGYLHGVVLKAVSEQYRMPDPDRPGKTIRYAVKGWKELFKGQFGDLDSTEHLSDDEYALLVREVEAHAVVDLHVQLPDEDRPPGLGRPALRGKDGGQ